MCEVVLRYTHTCIYQYNVIFNLYLYITCVRWSLDTHTCIYQYNVIFNLYLYIPCGEVVLRYTHTCIYQYNVIFNLYLYITCVRWSLDTHIHVYINIM